MSQPNSAKKHNRIRLSLDPKERFPEKLYDVANDGYLVSWNGTGTSVTVSEEGFEDKVMECYPGFLQISSFANFRRLFREYGFEWKFHSKRDEFEFSHDSFVYGRRDLLDNINTRRRSFARPIHAPSAFQRRVAELSSMDVDSDEDEKPRKYLTRTRTGATKPRKYSAGYTRRNSRKSDESGFQINDSFSSYDLDYSQIYERDDSNCNREDDFSERAEDIMRSFIRNEFTFEDFCIWAASNQSHLLNELQGIQTLSGNARPFNATSYPCGNCACCDAYRNMELQQECDSQHSDSDITDMYMFPIPDVELSSVENSETGSD